MRTINRSVLLRWSVYLLIWVGIISFTYVLFRRGAQVHRDLQWVALLHPVLFSLTAWPFLRALILGKRWFRIRYGVLVMTYIWTGLGSAYYIFHFQDLGYPTLQVPTVGLEAMIVVFLGTVTFVVVERSRVIRAISGLLPRLPETPQWSLSIRVGLYALLTVTVLITAFLISTGSYIYQSEPAVSGLLSAVQFFQRAGLVGLSAGYFYWFTGTSGFKRFDKLVLLAATGTLATLGLISGMKMEVLLIGLHVGLPYLILRHYGYTSFKMSKSIVLGGLLLVVGLFALNPVYRAGLRQFGSDQNPIKRGLEAATATPELISSEPQLVQNLMEVGFLKMWSRTAMYTNLIPILDQTPEEISYLGFQQYLSLPATAVVPRVIWPAKPVNTLPTDFQRRYVSGEKIFANLPTTFGIGYMRGGMLGVAIVFALLGSLAAIVEEYTLGNRSPTLLAVLLYTVGFRIVVNIETDMYWRLNGVPKEFAVLVVAYLTITGLSVVEKRLMGRSAS